MDAVVSQYEGAKIDSSVASEKPAKVERPSAERTAAVGFVAQESVKVDAVSIDLTAGGRATAKYGSAKSEKKPDISAEQAEKIAKDVAADLNRTSLQFNVSVAETSGDMNFQVVDRETGKVVREFPPEGLPEVLKQINEKGGVVVEEAA